MEKKYEEALDKSMELLVKSMPSILEMILVKMNTDFLDHQKEMIRSQNSSVRKVVEFVNVLKTLQKEVLFKFLDVLDQLNYQHVANEIRREAGIDIPQPRAPPQNSKRINKTFGVTYVLNLFGGFYFMATLCFQSIVYFNVVVIIILLLFLCPLFRHVIGQC